jgi:hypothetical protein
VIARLPFIERPSHPAGTPVFVISRPLSGSGARDVILWSARFERWSEAAADAVAAIGGEIVASAGERDGLSILADVPGSWTRDNLLGLFAGAGAAPRGLVEVGAHAERFRAPGAAV